MFVNSAALGLSGRIDCLIALTTNSFQDACGNPPDNRPDWFVPVEYKSTFDANQRHNILQLAAYAMMVEEMTATFVPFAFIVLLPQEEAVRIEIGPGIKRQVAALVQTVRAGIMADDLPDPTPHRGKCVECEFRQFCNDVL